MLNPLDLTGRTILVTGASSGIGRATSLLISRLGARVILVARNRERLEETQRSLEGIGHAVEVCDLGGYEGLPEWIRGLVVRHGPLDGLVHSAGIQITAPLKTMEAEACEALWRINVMASLWLAKGYRHPTVNRSGGSLVFVSSIAGIVGQPAIAAYSASKAAVIGLTRSVALELARQHIRVNCIAPAHVETRMSQEFGAGLTEEQFADVKKEHPLGVGQALDVANAAAFLLSSAARWITGSVLVVDGGYTAH